MKIEHDGDGKLFYITERKTVRFITECDIASADSVAKCFNLLISRKFMPACIPESMHSFEPTAGSDGKTYYPCKYCGHLPETYV